MAKEVAAASIKYWMAAFKNQKWLSKDWKEVQRRTAGTNAYKYPKKRGLSRRTKPILIKTGALRRAVNNSTKSVTSKTIKFQVPLPYAQIHNEGLRMKNGRKMPKRQFMGYSRELSTIHAKIIKKYADRALRASR